MEKALDGKAPPEPTVPVTVLRLDRPELDAEARLVLRAPPDARERESRRVNPNVPLAYLYERPDPDAPRTDLTIAVGHYDAENLVWEELQIWVTPTGDITLGVYTKTSTGSGCSGADCVTDDACF